MLHSVAVPDPDCVDFLRWALPRIGLRWEGFRKVRRQVCRRVGRRIAELGLGDLDAYRAYLREHPDEWAKLERLTPITISRFYRDRAVFEALEHAVIPALGEEPRIWSAGCASGEEAYTLALICDGQVLASDIGPNKRVPMPRLRELLTEHGYEDVKTYVASGNVVLTSKASPRKLEKELEQLTEDEWGFDV